MAVMGTLNSNGGGCNPAVIIAIYAVLCVVPFQCYNGTISWLLYDHPFVYDHTASFTKECRTISGNILHVNE